MGFEGFPLFATKDDRVNHDARVDFDVVERIGNGLFLFPRQLVFIDENQQVDIAIRTGIATCLAAIQNSSCVGYVPMQDVFYLLNDTRLMILGRSMSVSACQTKIGILIDN